MRQLPVESAYKQRLLGEYAGWTIDSYLLANAVDKLALLLWYQTEDATKKPDQRKHVPKPTWRPGQKDETPEQPERPRLTREEARAALDRIRDGGDDVSLSRSAPRSYPSSRRRAASKGTSPKS